MKYSNWKKHIFLHIFWITRPMWGDIFSMDLADNRVYYWLVEWEKKLYFINLHLKFFFLANFINYKKKKIRILRILITYKYFTQILQWFSSFQNLDYLLKNKIVLISFAIFILVYIWASYILILYPTCK